MQKICISLINYNGQAQTLACLNSLEELITPDISLFVVVIDNASEILFQIGSRTYKNFSLKIIAEKENRGFSGGHNVGIRYGTSIQAEYILILNNDITVHKNLLVSLLTGFTDKKIGAVVPKIYFAKGHEFHKNKYTTKDLGNVLWYAGASMDWDNIYGKHRGVDEVDHGQYDLEELTELITGCCALIKSEVFHNMGMFDERYFLYYEDADLSMRMKKQGYTIAYVPKAMLWHINAGSTGGSGSDLQDYFLSRNRLLFGFSYGPFRTKVAMVKESLRLLNTGRVWQKKGIQDFFLRKFGKGTYHV
ncbi:glycosyltransferase family 2 protein [soil metagenome]